MVKLKKWSDTVSPPKDLRANSRGVMPRPEGNKAEKQSTQAHHCKADDSEIIKSKNSHSTLLSPVLINEM